MKCFFIDWCIIRVVVVEEYEFFCLEGVLWFFSVCVIIFIIICSEWRFKFLIFFELNVVCYCCCFVVKFREKEWLVSDIDLIVSNWNFCFWMFYLLGFRMVEFYVKYDYVVVWMRFLIFCCLIEVLMVFKFRMVMIVFLEVFVIIVVCVMVGLYFLYYGFCMIFLFCICKWCWYMIMNCLLKIFVNGFVVWMKFCSFL